MNESLPLISGYKEWAEANYPLAAGWNSGTDILLRQAWMAAVAAERERCAKVCDGYPSRDPAEDGSGYWAAQECAAAIRNS